MVDFGRLALAVVLAGTVAKVAHRRQSLSTSGAWAAFVSGSALFAFGTVFWYAPLLFFFVSSSALSKLPKPKSVERDFAKGGRRDALQVLANGGEAPLWLWAARAWPGASEALYIGYMARLAAATADTWATEVGVFRRERPRLLGLFGPVEPGTSGGMTPSGTVAGALGALLIGTLAAVQIICSQGMRASALWAAGLVGSAGFLGMMLDSVFGAFWQHRRRCRRCGKIVEALEHCGLPTVYAGGRRWMTNDAVNAMSGLFSALIAAGAAYFWRF
ncbi:MAG: DUF92 domain-containing protein [Hydrogenibacillus sp.]|nr:DUF92 domain-containing protein [Hydrogenibacillus sp.]